MRALRISVAVGLFSVVASLALAQQAAPPSQQANPGLQGTPAQAALPTPLVKVGEMAPNFTLKDQNGKLVSLKDFRGKQNVAVAFYVFAFSPGCSQEAKSFQQNLQKLEAANTQVLGITMDSGFANKAWTSDLGISFPTLSDWGGDVTRRYGIFNSQTKVARRATFLVDKTGKIVDIQLDREALDPTNVVTACERHNLKG